MAVDDRPASENVEKTLVDAALNLDWADVPKEVRRSISNLFLDWLGSAIGGTGSGPVARIVLTAADLGLGCSNSSTGLATAIPTSQKTSPLWAAFVNGASSHVAEMDDLHNASMYHPGTCVFPAAFAVAESLSLPGAELLAAALTGYEVSLRIGEALGTEHYAYFHTTGTAGTFGAAVAAGRLLHLDSEQMIWALGNAGTQAAGLWEFLADGAMSKQLHTGKAALNGLLASYLGRHGFSGPRKILVGDRGILKAMTAAGAIERGLHGPDEVAKHQVGRLLQGIAGMPSKAGFTQFKTPEVSFKFHASCRHTHPAVDALLDAMARDHIRPDNIASIRAHVYSGAFERLKDVEASSPWAAKFNIPFCLARAAQRGDLQLDAFSEEALHDLEVCSLMSKTELHVDTELDKLYPLRWSAWVEVVTKDGNVHVSRVEEPKGDPGNPLDAEELDSKFMALTTPFLGEQSASVLLQRCRSLEDLPSVAGLLDGMTVRTGAEGG